MTYNITNTYITYIGANEAYDKKEYQYYYELPDGRSSADLTAEDVAGISFQFHDVTNYAKSATDVSVRALYHFDGDSTDSSYFSTQGKFYWTTGASITYMDSGVFNGALYLDNNAHAFDVTLPSNIGAGDFSLQFRYYQASQPDTQSNIENSLKIGAATLLSWDEQKFYSGTSTTPIASMPIGSWSEIALVRHSGKLYIYLNGLCISNGSNTTILPNILTFTLGASSRANSMLDELRLVNFAVAENGKSYTPTTVPHDSNLVLVLPDSAQPVADEYVEITSSGKNLLGYDFKAFTSGTVPSNLQTVNMPTALGTSGGYTIYPNFYVANGYSTLQAYDGYVRLTRLSALDHTYNGGSGKYHYCAGLSTCLSMPNIKGSTNYVFSVVLADGTVCSLPFKSWLYPSTSVSWAADKFSRTFDWGTLTVGPFADNEWNDDAYHFYGLSIAPKATAGAFVDILYKELVEGTSTDLSTELISCVYPEEKVQPNTAAVQTDIPITGYTVGGVRPTFPAKGNVWFPVSGRRIAGAYVYTGTMWKDVGCRYYTGTRWIPIYAFDIVTLEDCFDIADASDASPPITTESGFWNWWKGQWLDFRKWLESVLGSGSGSGGSGGGGGSSGDSALDTIVTGLLGAIFEILKTLLGLVGDVLSFIFGFLTETVLGGIKDFFASFGDGPLFDFLQPPAEEGGSHTLPGGVAAVFAFFSGVIMLLPGELKGILFFGIAALLLFGVFKLIKS